MDPVPRRIGTALFESSARQAADPPASPGELFPHVEDARWVRIRALGTDVFVAEYEIAVLARRCCLVVKAIGPVPNQVDVRALDGSC